MTKPLTPEQEAAQVAQAIKRMQDEMRSAAYMERNILLAQDRWFRYLAHKEAGFTEQQALELVK